MAEQSENIISVVHSNMEPYARETFDRAFPSYADHLKPVVRRIIFSMWEEDITTNFRKVAQVVGYTMGNYHPHGDSSIYEALVNLTQPFGLNYPLVTGQGAFGNLDGDRASAARYIECKLSMFARDVITSEIDRNSVDYRDNYDQRRKEPVFLPTKLPLALLNGSEGIGVAFAVSIPPHNIDDVVKMVTRFIKNKSIPLSQLVDGVYPDFPTYGIITNGKEVQKIYKDGGSGVVRLRAKYELDQANGVIRFSEIPYGKNGQNIKTEIQELINKGNIVLSSAITAIYDIDKKDKSYVEDDCLMQFEVICKKEANLQQVLQILLAKTGLSSYYKINMMLGYGERVRQVNIREMISEWYNIRVNTIHRKFMHESTSLENRYHVSEGLYNSYDKIDDIIKTIRSLGGREETLEALHKKFGFSLKQSEGIYEMSLGSLGKTPKVELKKRMDAARQRLDEIHLVLKDIDGYILNEIEAIRKKYSRPRRSMVVDTTAEVQQTRTLLSRGGILWNKEMVGIFNDDGLSNGSKIINGLRGENRTILGANTVDRELTGILVIFLNGNATRLEVNDIPAVNVWIPLENQSEILKVLPIYKETLGFVMINRARKVKRVVLDDFTPRRAVSLGDPVVAAVPYCSEEDEVLAITQNGKYFFDIASNLPVVGRNAAGVKTHFEENDAITMLVPDRVNNDLLNIFLKKNGEDDFYLHTMFFNKLKKVKRQNGYKNLLGKVESFTLTNLIQTLNESKRPLYLITAERAYETSARNFKKTNQPKKLGSPAFYAVVSGKES